MAGPYWYPRTTLQLGSYKSEWHKLPPGAMLSPGPGTLLRTMSGSMILPQQGSVLMSVAHAATKDHTDAQGLGHNWWPCWYPRAMLSWHCLLLALGELVLSLREELAPLLTTGMGELAPMAWVEKSLLCLSPKELVVVPATQTNQTNYHPDSHPSL